MVHDHDELAQAIFFFDGDGPVAREMHVAEFDAVLDGFVPAYEWAGKRANAVFVEIDSDFELRSAVFFLVSFTKKGAVDPAWNLPLDELARSATKGPDLGKGPIRLACSSQCPIQHFRDFLWDPDMRMGKGQLKQLHSAIKRNKLALQFREPEVYRNELEVGAASVSQINGQMEQNILGQLRKEYEKELRDHMAQLLREQRLRSSTISNDNQHVTQQLKAEHTQRIDEYRNLLEEKERALTEEQDKNSHLKETIDGQAQKIEGLREYFEHKLNKVQGEEGYQLEHLKENYELEMQAKIEAAVKELKETLQMREVELLYRNEQESHLKLEVARLREEQLEITSNSGDHLLEKMVAKGISFVTYQPGAGHITIPSSDVSRFMDNPAIYAAKNCGVNEQHYIAWLDHYQAPVCNCSNSAGICGANIPRINLPVDFIIGDGDRCSSHKDLKGATKLVRAGA